MTKKQTVVSRNWSNYSEFRYIREKQMYCKRSFFCLALTLLKLNLCCFLVHYSYTFTWSMNYSERLLVGSLTNPM